MLSLFSVSQTRAVAITQNIIEMGGYMKNLLLGGSAGLAGGLPAGKIVAALAIVVLLLNSAFVISPSEEAGTRWLGGHYR